MILFLFFCHYYPKCYIQHIFFNIYNLLRRSRLKSTSLANQKTKICVISIYGFFSLHPINLANLFIVKINCKIRRKCWPSGNFSHATVPPILKPIVKSNLEHKNSVHILYTNKYLLFLEHINLFGFHCFTIVRVISIILRTRKMCWMPTINRKKRNCQYKIV